MFLWYPLAVSCMRQGAQLQSKDAHHGLTAGHSSPTDLMCLMAKPSCLSVHTLMALFTTPSIRHLTLDIISLRADGISVARRHQPGLQ